MNTLKKNDKVKHVNQLILTRYSWIGTIQSELDNGFYRVRWENRNTKIWKLDHKDILIKL